jgi:hypothetical protein
MDVQQRLNVWELTAQPPSPGSWQSATRGEDADELRNCAGHQESSVSVARATISRVP